MVIHAIPTYTWYGQVPLECVLFRLVKIMIYVDVGVKWNLIKVIITRLMFKTVPFSQRSSLKMVSSQPCLHTLDAWYTVWNRCHQEKESPDELNCKLSISTAPAFWCGQIGFKHQLCHRSNSLCVVYVIIVQFTMSRKNVSFIFFGDLPNYTFLERLEPTEPEK